MATQVKVQRLCTHHDVDGFECGEESFDVNLWLHWRESDSGDQTMVFAALQQSHVVGYVAFQDLLVYDTDRDINHRVIFLTSLAVAQNWHGTDIAAKLIQKVYDVKRLRSAGRRGVYRGAVCTSFHNAKVEEYLSSHGFQSWPGTLYWWRPFRR